MLLSIVRLVHGTQGLYSGLYAVTKNIRIKRNWSERRVGDVCIKAFCKTFLNGKNTFWNMVGIVKFFGIINSIQGVKTVSLKT